MDLSHTFGMHTLMQVRDRVLAEKEEEIEVLVFGSALDDVLLGQGASASWVPRCARIT